MVVRKCAWCERVIGEKPPFDDTSITHTICHRCYREVLKDALVFFGTAVVQSLKKWKKGEKEFRAKVFKQCERLTKGE